MQNFTNSNEGNQGRGLPLNPDGSIMTPDDQHRNETFYGGRPGVAEADVARARANAAAANQRGAYQTDFTQSDASRGYQTNALDALQGAANGTAPSQAAELANAQTAAAIRGGQSIAATTKGGVGARIAAARAGNMQAATTAATGANLAAQMKAKEAADARGTFANAATATRSTDLNAAQLQQQAELQQRQLNQGNEQFYETQATGIRGADQQAGLQRNTQDSTNALQGRQNKLAEEKQGWEKTKDIIGIGTGAVTGVLGGILKSDERAKTGIGGVDIGPLAHLGLGGAPPAAAPESFAKSGMQNGSPLGELQAHSDFATQFQSNPGSGPSMTSRRENESPFYGRPHRY
jgi:hypothetical protein